MPSKLETPLQWDEFLSINYGYGIWDFTYSLAGVLNSRGDTYFFRPNEGFPRSLRHDGAPWRKSLRETAEKYEKIKSFNIKHLAECLISLGQIDERESSKRKAELVAERYGLQKFFRGLENEAKSLREFEEYRPPRGGKGPPLKFINEVAYLWSEVMKDENGKPQWEDIIELLNKFFVWLGSTDYGRALSGVHDLDKINLCFRLSQIKKQKHYGYLRGVGSYYFPTEKNHRCFPIKFTDHFINIDISKNQRVIIFPNGERFEDESPAPIMPRSKQKPIKINLTREDKKRYQKYIRMRQEGGISLKGSPAIN